MLCWLSACVPHRPPVGPIEHSEALAEARRGWELFVSWDGIVELKGRYRGRRFSGREAVVMERGARLYLETLLPLGKAGPVVGITPGRLRVVWPTDALYYEGPASAEGIERLVGLAVEPVELLALLSGYGLPWNLYAVTHESVGGEGLVMIELESEDLGRRATLVLDAGLPGIRSGSVRGPSGSQVYRFDYRELRRLGPFAYPRRIQLEAEDLELEARLRHEQRNTGLRDPELFRPPPPQDARRLFLSDVREPLLLPAEEE